jgi:predicted phosphodiesterase
MASNRVCSVCVAAFENGITLTKNHSNRWWANTLDVSEASVRRHYAHGPQPRLAAEGVSAETSEPTQPQTIVEDSSTGHKSFEAVNARPVTLADAREWLQSSGDDPENYHVSIRTSVNAKGGFTNRMSAWPKAKRNEDGTLVSGEPEWIPVQPAQRVQVIVPEFSAPSLVGLWKTAIANADHQIGFRGDQPFHDTRAMNISSYIVGIEQPDQVIYCGDFLDLPQQSKYEQEAAFAGTTQRAIDAGHLYLATDRALAPNASIILIEGNHDRRLQNFMSQNAMSAHGLKKANYPESWPVMSLPNLLNLDEVDVKYIDAYPAGAWWINDNLRAIHGDKVRSNGSTASAYANATPNISTIFGHTHRAEVQTKTTLGPRGTKIKSMSINPGCMCRVDGEVPSVHGSTGIDGKAAQTWEDWNQGLAVIRYKESGEFFPTIVHIEDGVAIYEGQELRG